MALKKCKECGGKVSTKAKECPSCGAPVKAKTSGCLILLIIFIVIAAISAIGDDKSKPPKRTVAQTVAAAKDKQLKDEACRQNLQCWGDKHGIAAAIYCADHIEYLAKYSHEWTDGILEPKFSRFRWKDKKAGVITYFGDKIKFQNGFGAWQNMVYECDFNTLTEKPLNVRARAGRL